MKPRKGRRRSKSLNIRNTDVTGIAGAVRLSDYTGSYREIFDTAPRSIPHIDYLSLGIRNE